MQYSTIKYIYICINDLTVKVKFEGLSGEFGNHSSIYVLQMSKRSADVQDLFAEQQYKT